VLCHTPHELDALISADTHVLDVPDLIILPAFEDTHNHLILAAQYGPGFC
jgi:predicted amidohydrolase YtcJ